MPPMTIHKWLGTALAVIFIGLVFWRWRIHRRAQGAPSWAYLACAAIVLGALTLQGHLGGKMSFDSSAESSGHDRSSATRAESSDHGNDHGPQWRDHIDMKE